MWVAPMINNIHVGHVFQIDKKIMSMGGSGWISSCRTINEQGFDSLDGGWACAC